jgi:hypothetical protein
MVAINRVFDIFRGVSPLRARPSDVAQADRERGQLMSGRPFAQTEDEIARTRSQMEAELDAQRERRAAAKG